MIDYFDFPLTVANDEIDRLGHANNLAYLEWMIRAAVAHSDALGWTTDRYMRLGAVWVVRSHEIRYLRSALPADRLVVRTWVATMRRSSSLRRYEIVRSADRKTLATAATQWVFVDLQSRLPRRIAPEVAASFVIIPDGNPRAPDA